MKRTSRVVVMENPSRPPALAAALAMSGFEITTSISRAHVIVVDSLEALCALRETGCATPALAVCGDPVAALTAGADECVTPPYSVAELGARGKALVDRIYGRKDWRPCPIRIGRLTICPVTRDASRDGVPVRLSPKEHALLVALLQGRGAVMSRRDLMARVWPEGAAPNARTLDMHVAWLRQKIEPDVKQPRIIRTVRSVGYLICAG